jgi:hypothetical protein
VAGNVVAFIGSQYPRLEQMRTCSGEPKGNGEQSIAPSATRTERAEATVLIRLDMNADAAYPIIHYSRAPVQ